MSTLAARRRANVAGWGLSAPFTAVLVVFLPDYRSWAYVQSHPESYERTVAVTVGKVLEDHGIKTVDLLKRFMDLGLDRDTLYLPCDGHWNAAGQQAAFRVLRPVVHDLLRGSTRVAGLGVVSCTRRVW